MHRDKTNFSTDSSGHYSVAVALDTYSFRFAHDYAYGSQKIFLYNSSVTAPYIDATNGDVVQDLQFDNVVFNVSFVDAHGNPIANAPVSVQAYSGHTTLAVGRPDILFYPASVFAYPGSTGANGVLATAALRGIKYEVCAVNPATSISTCAVTTPTSDTSSVTITAPPVNYTILGTFTDRVGNPIGNAQLEADPSSGNPVYFSTDSTGHYSVNVSSDTYSLRFHQSYIYAGSKTFLYGLANFIDATSSNVTLNLQLDNVALNINFVDANNAPIANAPVSVQAYSGSTTLAVGRPDVPFYTGDLFNYPGSTNTSGLIGTTVLRGLKYEICAVNPATSISTCQIVTPTTDVSTITLNAPSLKPATPTGLSAQSPTNHYPALTWSAVSGADHYDVYRDGVTVGSSTNAAYGDTTLGEGSHDYYVVAVNSTGQASDPSVPVTVVYDVTAPTITYSESPNANSDGWNNADVTVAFTCSDSLSGVQTCPAPVTASTEGASQTVTGSATDQAGNTVSATAHIRLDKTAPTITYSVSPAANASGWNNSDATVTFTCADVLSGIKTCPAPVVVSADGGNQSVTGTAVDSAGNTASATAVVNLDKTAPTISYSMSPVPNAAGWNKSDVTVTFQCADVLSGVASCSTPVTVSAENADNTVTGTAVDAAGNTKSVTAHIKIDKTAPVISYSLDKTPNANGWFKSAVTATFTCSDALSGVTSCPSPVTYSAEGSNTINQTITDIAGNVGTVTATVKVDKTAPVVTAAVAPAPNAAGWNNSGVTVTFTCSDATSDIQTCPAPVTVSTEGSAVVVTRTAVDLAGNIADASATIKLDKTKPTASNGAMGTTFFLFGGTTSVSATATDALSGVVNGEYYIDSDPGAGNGTAMTYSGGKISGTATIPNNLSLGQHKLYIRSKDAAGNWSTAVSVTFTFI